MSPSHFQCKFLVGRNLRDRTLWSLATVSQPLPLNIGGRRLEERDDRWLKGGKGLKGQWDEGLVVVYNRVRID